MSFPGNCYWIKSSRLGLAQTLCLGAGPRTSPGQNTQTSALSSGRRQTSERRSVDSMKWVRDYKNQKRSDPRDKIYGLLGLVKNSHSEGVQNVIVPDYSTSELHVALHTLRHHLNGGMFPQHIAAAAHLVEILDLRPTSAGVAQLAARCRDKLQIAAVLNDIQDRDDIGTVGWHSSCRNVIAAHFGICIYPAARRPATDRADVRSAPFETKKATARDSYSMRKQIGMLYYSIAGCTQYKRQLRDSSLNTEEYLCTIVLQTEAPDPADGDVLVYVDEEDVLIYVLRQMEAKQEVSAETGLSKYSQDKYRRRSVQL